MSGSFSNRTIDSVHQDDGSQISSGDAISIESKCAKMCCASDCIVALDCIYDSVKEKKNTHIRNECCLSAVVQWQSVALLTHSRGTTIKSKDSERKMAAFVPGLPIITASQPATAADNVPIATCRPVSEAESLVNDANIKLTEEMQTKKEEMQKQTEELVQLRKKLSATNKLLHRRGILIKNANASLAKSIQDIKRLRFENNQLQLDADDCKDTNAAGTNLLHIATKTLLKRRKKEIEEQKILIHHLRLRLHEHSARFKEHQAERKEHQDKMALISTHVQQIETILRKNKGASFVTYETKRHH